MKLINGDELKEWANSAKLTPDGGIDINDFNEKLDSIHPVMSNCEFELAQELLRRLARKLEKELLRGSNRG